MSKEIDFEAWGIEIEATVPKTCQVYLRPYLTDVEVTKNSSDGQSSFTQLKAEEDWSSSLSPIDKDQFRIDKEKGLVYFSKNNIGDSVVIGYHYHMTVIEMRCRRNVTKEDLNHFLRHRSLVRCVGQTKRLASAIRALHITPEDILVATVGECTTEEMEEFTLKLSDMQEELYPNKNSGIVVLSRGTTLETLPRAVAKEVLEEIIGK